MDQVLTSENCAQLVWVLITQFLPLDEDYLSEWAEEPERAIAEESASELAEQGQAAVGGAMESEEPDVRLATMGLLLAITASTGRAALARPSPGTTSRLCVSRRSRRRRGPPPAARSWSYSAKARASVTVDMVSWRARRPSEPPAAPVPIDAPPTCFIWLFISGRRAQ